MLGFSLIVAFIALAPGLRAQTPAATETVNCYDPATETVETRFRGQCHGRIVDAAEASAIRQQRSEQIRRAMQVVPPPVAPDLKRVGIGTAFFVGGDGVLVTNAHVTKDCPALTVETPSGAVVAGQLLAQNPHQDLALVKADMASPAVAVFRRPVEMEGQTITVVGYPVHGLAPIQPQDISGQLTGPRDPGKNRFVFHADVRPGNSGGPVLDEAGLVVGVVFAKVDTVKVYQNTGRVVRELGYGIDNDTVLAFLNESGVMPHIAASAPTLAPEDLLAHARGIIARIGCWR